MNNYTFLNNGRIGLDADDYSQRALMSNRYAEYSTANYFNNVNSDSVYFATAQPSVVMNATNGVCPSVIDTESHFRLKSERERSIEKMQMLPRMFLTVPYLGKGSVDTMIESQLMQGEMATLPKSKSTVMDKSFMQYCLPPEEAERPKASGIEEDALNWMRGGMHSREISMNGNNLKDSRPSNRFI